MKMLCSVQLSKNRYKTPEGYLVCKNCIIARTGKQTYLKSELYGNYEGDDEYIDVDRSEKEVFDEKTMASFEGKPLTIEHPSQSVSPENYKELSVGNVHNVHRGTFEGQDVMYADINVYDAEAIDLIESGEMEELSCGYDCDITEGPNPEQINIRGNHVALCEQGRAGIARIQDSWGARPVIKDSVQKGTLIQEFGRYGEQYKIVKIEGNVLYCEELITHKNTLFKKDKENIDWAIINKSQVNDSLEGMLPKVKEWIKEHNPEAYRNWDYLTEYEKRQVFKKRKEWLLKQDSINWKTYDIILETDKGWHFTLNKVETEIHDKYGYSLGEVKENVEKGKRMLQCIPLEFTNVGETQIQKLEIGPFNDKEDAESFLPELKAMVNKYKDNEEISYQIVENKHEATLQKDSEEKVKLEECTNCYGMTQEELDKAWKKINEDKGTDSLGNNPNRKLKRFVNKEERDEFVKSLPEEAEVRMDEFDHGDSDKWLVYWEVYYWDPVMKDSKTRYVIALAGDGSEVDWLDNDDKPTASLENARTFTTFEEAKDYKNSHCKGEVRKISDSRLNDSKLEKEEIEVIKKLLENVEYEEPIKYDNELKVIDIYFSTKAELKKAGKKLVGLYDIELDEDEDELSITLYEKFNKERGISLTEDSDDWFGCNIRKGKPAEDFKQYLRDRGLLYEPSENGEFIHFEIRKADEDVKNQIKAIVEHYKKVGLHDEYDRKFYSKMIKALKEKLEKLERNELLDSNQEDYEIQKSNLRKEIKNQIQQYSEKLDALE